MSKKIYLVRKDPTCKKENSEWLQLTGREFFAFTKSPEGKGRYFIRLYDDLSYECDDIYIETTYAEYRAWHHEHDAHCYLAMQNKNFQILSLDAPAGGGEDNFMDTVSDDSISVEDLTIRELDIQKVKRIIMFFSPEEQEIIDSLYLSALPKKQIILAAEMNISVKALSKRKIKIIKKIRKMLGDFS